MSPFVYLFLTFNYAAFDGGRTSLFLLEQFHHGLYHINADTPFSKMAETLDTECVGS